MSFTDKLYMMIDDLPPLPPLKLPPSPPLKSKTKRYLSDYHSQKKQDIRNYFKPIIVKM